MAACAELRSALAASSARRTSESSSVASNCPSRTCVPSSKYTAVTRPVILEAMAARRNVPAGVEKRLPPARIGFGSSRDLNHGPLVAESIRSRDDAREDQDRDRSIEDAFAHLRLAPQPVVDAQGAQVGFR